MSTNTEHEAFVMAREMLGVEKLGTELTARIAKVIKLIESVSEYDGGTLRSRQIVAIIVEQCERDTL